MRPTDDPRVLLETLVADARRDFAADADGWIALLERFAQAQGTVDPDALAAAIAELKQFALEKFARRVSLTSIETDTLRSLVIEAYDWLSDPRSQVNLKNWRAVAEPFVKGDR